jgi:hydrogenase maturation protease
LIVAFNETETSSQEDSEMGAARTIPIELQAKPAGNRKLPEVLVLGLGNTRLSDGGIGVRVVRHLARDPETPHGLLPLDAGAFGFCWISKFKRAHAILIVDVAEIDAPAGATCLLEGEELVEHVRRSGRIAAYGSGLTELLDLARLQAYKPKRLALLAVQPASLDWGEDLSAPVSESLPVVCEQVIDIVLAWQRAANEVSDLQTLGEFSTNRRSVVFSKGIQGV